MTRKKPPVDSLSPSTVTLLRISWRDARGSYGKAVLYAMSMAVGIASLVAMMSFGANLASAIDGKAKELLGADLVISGREPFEPELAALTDSMRGEVAEQLRFATMARFLKQDQATLARVRGIEGSYPFYGVLETEPPQAAQDFRNGAKALVDASLMDRFEAAIGDKIQLGQATFTIVGALLDTPGESASAAMMGPRIYIPKEWVAKTELIQFGSRVFYSRAFKLDPGQNADGWVEANKQALNDARLRVETVASLEEQLGQSMAQLRDFLTLAACLALLLGGLGVASAVHYHLKQKAQQIAVMRCLGAKLSQVAVIYLGQVTVLMGMATCAGVGLGVAIQFYLPSLIQDFVPFDFQPSLQPVALMIAVGWGIVLCAGLAIAPLLAIRHISPLATMRVAEATEAKRDKLAMASYAGIALVWWLFAWFQSESWTIASWFLGGLLASLGLFLLVAKTLAMLARKMLVLNLPFTLRYGIASLFRPSNHTAVLTMVLGMGVFLIVILAGSRALLLGQFDAALSGDRPNFIAFDIQADQVEGVQAQFKNAGIEARSPIPLVPMRLAEIKGVPVESLMGGDIPEWMLQREYRSTYRTDQTSTETMTEGSWVSHASFDEQPVPISLDADLAKVFELGVGDAMVVDVMGIPLEVSIANLRKIQWESMQPNFYMVFPEGVLNDAPQMFLIPANTKDAAEVGRIQRELVKAYPNVTCVDMARLAENIESIISKAAMIVEFLATLCVLTGLLLMGSSLWNSRYQRMGEHALLQTLGARKPQIRKVALAEFLLLGVFSAISGAFLGGVATWALARFLFKLSTGMVYWPMILPLIGLPIFTAVVGYLGLRGSGKKAMYTVLREESP